MNKRSLVISLLLFFILTLNGCSFSGSSEEGKIPISNTLNSILAAKAPFALSKTDTPVFNSYEWDSIFSDKLKYDRFGEVDELVFVALPGTAFDLQRQIRKKTRAGAETIYYKVTTDAYKGNEDLWIDGRFLDIQDIRPKVSSEKVSAAKTLKRLRSYEGLPYTWHGSSENGVPELLTFYPPVKKLSKRSQDDWIMKGFDSSGMLYHASGGRTPVDIKSLALFGKAIFVDLDKLNDSEEDKAKLLLKKAETLINILKPLDIIQSGDRVWIVLDQGQVIESRYRSNFDGGVQISSLLDTIHGLLSKSVYVKDSFQELEDKTTKKFFIRRYANTDKLLEDLLLEAEENINGKTKLDNRVELLESN